MAKALKASRVGFKAWLSREADDIDSLIDSKDVSVQAIKLQLKEFDSRLEKFDDICTQIQVELSVDEVVMNADIDEAFRYRKKVMASKLRALETLEEMSSAKAGDGKPGSRSSSGGPSTCKTQTKLPKLEIEKFSGDITAWKSFWEQFEASIHKNDNVPVLDKFGYLRKFLHGEALDVIKGLSLTADNYTIARAALEDRYNKPERTIFLHIQSLLQISSSGNSVNSLWKLRDQIMIHVRCLESLGVSKAGYGVILTPLILSRLPKDIRLEWARSSKGKEQDLEFLLTFLTEEIENRERAEGFKQLTSNTHPVQSKSTEADNGAASALSVNTSHTSAKMRCEICGGSSHPSRKCYTLMNLPPTERKAMLREKSLCYRCLKTFNSGHKNCNAKCAKCGRHGHHEVLCIPREALQNKNNNRSNNMNSPQPENKGVYHSSERSTPNDSKDTSVVTICAVQEQTVLQTAVVTVQSCNSKQPIKCTVLFDTGSDNTFITSRVVQRLQPQWVSSRNVGYASFGGERRSSKSHNVYRVDVTTKQGEKSLQAIEVQTICAPLQKPKLPPHLISQALSNSQIDIVDLVESPHGEIKIDILIGLDQYWNFVKGDVKHLVPECLVLQDTVLGWMFSGSWGDVIPTEGSSSQMLVHQLVCLSDCDIQKFWNLESIGISDDIDSSTSDTLLEQFNSSVKLVEGRYEVKLPWKENIAELNLLNNRKVAEKRLDSLERKLSKDKDLETSYLQVFHEMESSDIIRQIKPADDTAERVFYLPHRPVIKESSVSTKIRPVFDASSKGSNGVSLNDCLETGPCLIPSLVDILIRFRRWQIGITADITKAFHQIKLCKTDQDAVRFLLKEDGQVKTYVFQRVPFGCTSSPFLLNATVKYHLSQYPESRALTELKENLFIDDWLSGADTDYEACQLYQDGDKIMNEGSFPLAKSYSNSDEVTQMFFREYGCKMSDAEVVKILGMGWLRQVDYFGFDGMDISPKLVTTKRVVLSLLARLFDPLGFLNPFIMYIKVLLQEIWILNLEWDEVVPADINHRFQLWLSGLDVIRGWRIPRCYTVLPWSNLKLEQMELVCFGDASEKGYGCCIYLRVDKGDGLYDVSLVASKARVAPVKKISLPRLELLAALLTARLLNVVRDALRLPSIAYSCWTDSTVTLSWIKGNPCKWKTFVANRVSEIQKLTNISHWSHCPGVGNPADLLSRGVLAKDLVTAGHWLNGPDWIHDSVLLSNAMVPLELAEQVLSTENVSVMVVTESWLPCDMGQYLDSERESVLVVVESWIPYEPVLDVARWGTFLKAVRIVAWILRFVSNMRNPDKQSTGDLSQNEISAGRLRLLQHVQSVSFGQELDVCRKNKNVCSNSPLAKLSPFVGKDDLLRVKGRLQLTNLSYGEKHPVILPKGHIAKLLVQDKHRFLKHAGVETVMTALRDDYWILGLRNITKSVKRECIACQKIDAKACNEFAAPLPELRVHQAPPFTVTGLDHAGPLYCVDQPGQKLYILLFTCAVIRSVHLEITDSLSEVDCVLAIRRFASRRGLPTIFYSDNAQNFQASNKELLKTFGTHSPKWKFIAPRSPWWGGWWERLIRSVKSALRKSLGNSRVTRRELETSLCEVEACVNSRPITFVGDDVDGYCPLSPSQFLIGKNAGFQSKIVEAETVVSQQDLSDHELIRQRQLEIFWELWSKDYVRNLPPSISKFKKAGAVVEGSLVMIREDNTPRLQWPLGRVVKVMPSKDNVIRSVEVKTSKGSYVRAIQRIHDLELVGSVDQKVDSGSTVPKEDSQQPTGQPGVVTRCGRQIKPREKLDL